ncbi:hypothetical protein [Cellulomonas xiejunii]|uniref:HEAT repeat domain-containing protein n=1 Tax=Cellulomonas xiejunii TaxID=2968083 RepID=A0ABY5KQZ6_9CELL|nr:hypothetical protein [Cellulomonas xiejunii]MCC2323453.1 hypothetical protein [Cellulomonas xiejunii]UUI71617.1 hypothetical protein NP048_17785 [Cellulomonas xiejunii]
MSATDGLPSARLRQLLDHMADATGCARVPGWADEHDRWHVYQAAVALCALGPSLREALASEPDEGVATSVVLLAFDRDPVREHRAWWVDALPADRRAFVARRADDLAVLEGVRDGSLTDVPDVTAWTHWLQRASAEQSTVPDVLEELARDGRTRKIRNIAAERLRIHHRAAARP